MYIILRTVGNIECWSGLSIAYKKKNKNELTNVSCKSEIKLDDF